MVVSYLDGFTPLRCRKTRRGAQPEAYISLTCSLFFISLSGRHLPRRNGVLRYLFEDPTLDTDIRELHHGADAVSITPQAPSPAR